MALLGEEMRIEDAEHILRRIQKRYDRKPEEDWRILMGRDSAGRLTQLIADSRDSWQIKGEMVKPRKFAGVGLKLDGINNEDLLDHGEPFYGIRPIEKDTIIRMLKGGSIGAMEELLTTPRMSLKKVFSADALVEGPILQSRSPITPISEKQRELEISLDRGLENLMRKKYPETRNYYG